MPWIRIPSVLSDRGQSQSVPVFGAGVQGKRLSDRAGIRKDQCGMTLDEIQLVNTPASFEPALDYVVTKMPRFPFDKFTDASRELGTQMKATGEAMGIGRTFGESLLKAVRSLETGKFHLYSPEFDKSTGRSCFHCQNGN